MIFKRYCYKRKIKKIRENILNSPLSKVNFYRTENGAEVDLSRIQPGRAPTEEYVIGHKYFVFGCQDIMVGYDGGLLLVVRKDYPAKGVLWPIGGRLLKGIPTEESLVDKVKEECNLEVIGKPIYLGVGRTAFWTAPFNHGYGTDTTNGRYFIKAKGTLKLNDLHKNATIVKPKDYTREFRSTLEDYVRDFMDLSMLFVEDMNPKLLYSYLNESILRKE